MSFPERRRRWYDPVWPRPGERIVPAVSGVMLAAAFPPLHPLLLSFVGLVPFLVWLSDLPEGRDGRGAAVRGGLLFGAVYFGLLFYWIFVALVWFTPWALAAFLTTWLVLAGVAALFAWTTHLGLRTVRLPLWVVAPIAWTGLEWLRANLPDVLAFPWLGLGTSLTGYPEWVGIAELVGARGVTFWLVLVNAVVATILLRRGSGAGLVGPGVLTALLVLGPAEWGMWRADSLNLRPAATIAVVQPNIPEHIKLDRDVVVDSTFASLGRLLPTIPPSSVDVVVLPEVVLPIYPGSVDATESVERLREFVREIGAPMIFGALGHDPVEGSRSIGPYNSAFLLGTGGLAEYRYDKRHLVPMVERVPFVPERWTAGFEYFGGYYAGDGWPLAQVDETGYGVLICYESTYPSAARAFRREGADVLVNITNDAWYGREEGWTRTSALWQHPAHLVMRAIEHRVGVARAANTGISLFVDPVGRISEASALSEADVRIETVFTTDERTLYTRVGDWVGTASAFGTLVLILSGIRILRSRRRLDPPGQP